MSARVSIAVLRPAPADSGAGAVLTSRPSSRIADQIRPPDQIIIEPDPDRTGCAATLNRALRAGDL